MITRPLISIDARLAAAQVALDNALPAGEIGKRLAAFGYGSARIDQGRALYAAALTLHQRQQAEYGQQYTATDKLQAAWAQADASYTPLVKVARVALKAQRGAWQALGLDGDRKQSLAGWLAQARQFYTNAQADEAILAQLGQFGISAKRLAAGHAEVQAVEAAKASQERERGEAQQATLTRDDALDALDDWMSDFIAIARVALDERPQLLEQLGVVEPS